MSHADDNPPAQLIPAGYQLSHLREAAADIAARFRLDLSGGEVEGWDDDTRAAYEHLHHRLMAEIVRLLARSPEKLMQLLYRIDVSEQKVNDAFAGPLGDPLADRLTTLVIERHLQKMLLRQQAAAWLPDMTESDN